MIKKTIKNWFLGGICLFNLNLYAANITAKEITDFWNDTPKNITKGTNIKTIQQHTDWDGATNSQFFEIVTENDSFVVKVIKDKYDAKNELRGSDAVLSQWNTYMFGKNSNSCCSTRFEHLIENTNIIVGINPILFNKEIKKENETVYLLLSKKLNATRLADLKPTSVEMKQIFYALPQMIAFMHQELSISINDNHPGNVFVDIWSKPGYTTCYTFDYSKAKVMMPQYSMPTYGDVTLLLLRPLLYGGWCTYENSGANVITTTSVCQQTATLETRESVVNCVRRVIQGTLLALLSFFEGWSVRKSGGYVCSKEIFVNCVDKWIVRICSRLSSAAQKYKDRTIFDDNFKNLKLEVISICDIFSSSLWPSESEVKTPLLEELDWMNKRCSDEIDESLYDSANS